MTLLVPSHTCSVAVDASECHGRDAVESLLGVLLRDGGHLPIIARISLRLFLQDEDKALGTRAKVLLSVARIVCQC
jgi:hypothetical protein